MSPRALSLPGHTVLVGCAGIAIAFIASTLIAQRTSVDIDAEALSISAAVAPSIEAISGARTELRHLESVVIRQIEQGTKGSALSEDIAAVRRELDLRLSQYVSDGEKCARLLASFHESIRALDLAAERALVLARQGADPRLTRQAGEQLRHLSDAASNVGAELIERDAGRVRTAAQQIERVRKRSNRAALFLNALCGAVAAAVAALVWRSQRRYQRLQQAHGIVLERRAEELEQFSARVAHDILGPLGAVSMALAVAERPTITPATRATALARGNASLQRAQRLVDGLLDFARAGAQPGPTSAAEVSPTVEGLVDELSSEAARARVTVQVTGMEPCSVACSTGALLSILSNLLRNALKYMGNSEQRLVTLRVLAGRGRVRFEVEDTGPGIPAGLDERVFQAYVRGPGSAQPGIGLGLATVQKLVVAHGGTVGVKSAPLGGALFWVEMPRAMDPEVVQKASPALLPVGQAVNEPAQPN
jgi:signal transduction histidine kinase